jgi:TfoX/Sxy family transcriptional regulator of competence genes
MAYDTKLENKIDEAIKNWKNVEKKKVFGGVCYLLKGNMALGIWNELLIVRVDKKEADQSLKERHVEPFNLSGRPASGWVMVKEPGWKNRAGLEKWIGSGKRFAQSLPEKNKRPGGARTLRERN